MCKNVALDIINSLRQYGGTPQGTTRLSYTKEFVAARDFLQVFMQEINMSTEVDSMGNLIGTYKGKKSNSAVWTGSHLDTVPLGGNYDGVVGIALPLACMYAWHQEGFVPEHDVKVIAMVEEEGTMFSMPCIASQVLCGEFVDRQEQDLRDNKTGKTLLDHLRACGLQGNPFQDAVLDMSRVRCFLEPHIEQGEDLELTNTELGIVTSIVGIDRYEFKLTGKSNHAGTTRMLSRQDALVAASYLTLKVHEAARAANGEFVATVGRMEITPNAVNVIPGEVIVYVEARAGDLEKLSEVKKMIHSILTQMQEIYNVDYEQIRLNRIAPVHLNKDIICDLQQACKDKGVSCKLMPSWAGHDAKAFAEHVPTAMLFLPSVKGVSHSVHEYTHPKDIDNAFDVFDVVLRKISNK